MLSGANDMKEECVSRECYKHSIQTVKVAFAANEEVALRSITNSNEIEEGANQGSTASCFFLVNSNITRCFSVMFVLPWTNTLCIAFKKHCQVAHANVRKVAQLAEK